MNRTGKIKKLQESLALLKILEMSRKSLDARKIKPIREAFKDVRRKTFTGR